VSRERDLAGRVLGAVVRMMPPDRSPWGRAMHAELAAIGPVRERLAFVAGCARVVAGQPAAYGKAGHVLVVAAALVGVGVKAATIAYIPLRAAAIAMVCVLALVSWLGRRRGALGPVGRSRSARLTRAAGYAMVAAMASELLANLGANPDQAPDAARAALPVTVVLATFLVGFLALTAQRTAATARVLIAGGGAGVGAALVWGLAVVALGPIPTRIVWAVLAVWGGMLAAALINTGRREGAANGVLAALCAGVVGTVSIVELVVALSVLGPPSLIPDLAPRALSAAADLAQSRNEIQDPYVVFAFIGFLLAAVMTVVALGAREHKPVTEPGPPRS